MDLCVNFFCCKKKKLFWYWLSEALIDGYSRILLGVILLLCSFSRIIVVGFPLGLCPMESQIPGHISHGLHSTKWNSFLHSRTQRERMHAFLLLHSYIDQDSQPRSGATHSGLDLPTSVATIKTIPSEHAHRPTQSRATLDSVKFTDKNHHKNQMFWIQGVSVALCLCCSTWLGSEHILHMLCTVFAFVSGTLNAACHTSAQIWDFCELWISS